MNRDFVKIYNRNGGASSVTPSLYIHMNVLSLYYLCFLSTYVHNTRFKSH